METQEVITPKIDALGRSYATGRRKTAVARVWIKSGEGKVQVNKLDMQAYFPYDALQIAIQSPFFHTRTLGHFDVVATVKGGGKSGQAGALILAISRALKIYNPETHAALKAHGLFTRDSRTVERKKYGRAKARKRFQFSKR